MNATPSSLPGMPNLHSHAFQRGMAGLAEMRGPAADSFWTWREVMYRFALSMTPDEVEAVAAQLYVEMLEAGFTRVGEFHYLHHDRDGTPYANIAEMARAHRGGGGGDRHRPDAAAGLLCPFRLRRRARRTRASAASSTISTASRACSEACRERRRPVSHGAVVGVAPHSLRAVTPDELAGRRRYAPAGPIHIHIAEQVKEVEDCLAWSGARPVEWLLGQRRRSTRAGA